MGNIDQCLVYDKPIGANGLSWKELEEWYNDNFLWIDKGPDLQTFLRASSGSVVEEHFYDAYIEVKNQNNGEVPALLPQVWLYYDPKLETERIKKIFEHQRMDFLLLLSDTRRIVIEIDGIQHYGEKKQILGRQYPDYIASVDKYAAMVSAQRDMTLAGYEVYRFGGKELSDETIGKRKAKVFLYDLFHKYHVIE